MLKHRKRISMFTLAIFMLTLVFSGMAPAFAATKTAPGSPPTADVQSSSSSRDNDRPNGVSPEGDAVKNSIGQGPNLNALGGDPYLESVTVTPGQIINFGQNNIGPYDITVPGSVDSIRFQTDPIDYTDKIIVSANSTWAGHTYNNYVDNITTDYKTDDIITLNAAGSNTTITYYLLNDGVITDNQRTYTFIVHRLPLVQSVTVSPDPLVMWAGGTAVGLAATIAPPAALQNVEWSVPAGAPVTISKTSALTALVTPVSAGLTSATATGDGGVQDSSNVYVLPQGASLNLPATLEMNLDTPNAYDLTAKVMMGANEQTYVDASLFQWSAGPEGVVTVESNKKTVKITPNKVGTTAVTVKIPVDNGDDLVATCQVTVGQIVLKVGTPLLKPNGNYTVWFGYENKFPYDVNLNLSTTENLNTGGHIISGTVPQQLSLNDNATAFQMEYGQSESPPAWAVTYVNWTRTVTAGKDVNAFVEVAPSDVKLVMGITETAQLTATARNSANPYSGSIVGAVSEITWGSEDPTIATVTPDWRYCTVTAQKPGVVRVYAEFNGTRAYSTITVLQPVESVSLQLNGQTLAPGAELLMSRNVKTLQAVIAPANANFPSPMLYEWFVTDPADSVDTDAVGNEIEIDPNTDNPGKVDITVNVRDMDGKIYATASCSIIVGRIDIWVEKEDPDFYDNGSYEASFGYSSTFPKGVEIEKTGDFSDVVLDCWRNTNSFDGSGEIIDGVRPTIFAPGTHHNEFRVKYWDGDQTWRVIFEGCQDKAVAKTFRSITLNKRWELMGLEDQFQLTADPSFCGFGNQPKPRGEEFQEEIVWEVLCETTEGVVSLDAEPNELTCNVKAQKPGMAIVMVSIAENCSSEAVPAQGGKHNRRHALCFVTVLDNRTLTLDQAELTVRRGRMADLNALIDYEELYSQTNTLSRFGLPEDWNEVQWGFLAEDEHGTYIADSSEYGTLTASGTDMTVGQFQGLRKGQTTVVAYLGNNCYSKRATDGLNVPSEFAKEVETLCIDRKLYLNRLPEDRFDTCVVTVKNPNRPVEPEPKKTTTPPVVTPPPAALETLDVTITVGNNLALVNDQQVTLAGNTLLIGEDRAMVDYADMAKLIPGLQVAWDWQALTVTFTKDGKEVKMVLDQVPAGFDVPFMNIGGRLVVPVRYVGSFFGATVDWINNTLVVHMYK